MKPTEECETNLTDIFTDKYKNKDNKKLVSKLYSRIRSNTKSSKNSKKRLTDNIRFKCEKESGTVITEEEWLNKCSVQT